MDSENGSAILEVCLGWWVALLLEKTILWVLSFKNKQINTQIYAK